ncbi:hypothetical protein [Massilia sp. LC238]|jgi:hypothetical protein|nr:hypothetical protein [Massilia sp. LC238]KFC72688.1 hypothetical protein FG94_01865 [Massilia sp. LC238]
MTQTATPAKPKFHPTPAMIAAAEALFIAIAYEQTVRPIVEGYQRKVLAERRWEVDPVMQVTDGVVEYVTDIKSAWLMSNSDHALYHQRCNEERIAAQISSAIDDSRSQDDCCPLLVAEEAVRQARFCLCDAMADITKIDGARAVTLAAAHQDRIVDLSLRLLAPFVKNPLALLKAS